MPKDQERPQVFSKGVQSFGEASDVADYKGVLGDAPIGRFLMHMVHLSQIKFEKMFVDGFKK